MKDQANKLREMALNLRNQIESELLTSKQTRVIVVASGKGGVGKSTLALNLSLYLCKIGKKVVLMDADMGMANIDIMLGLLPKYNIYHMIQNGKRIQDIMVDGPMGLKVIPGGSGIAELANLNDEDIKRIIYEMGKLDGDFDFMIVDTGAGISSSVLSFILATDEIIIVTTSEPTSLTDAYGTVKSATKAGYSGTINLVVNRVNKETEGILVAQKFKMVTEKFLNLDVHVLGHIIQDPQVEQGIMQQQPLLQAFPRSEAAQNIRNIAEKLIDQDAKEEPMQVEDKKPGGIRAFFKRFTSFSHSD